MRFSPGCCWCAVQSGSSNTTATVCDFEIDGHCSIVPAQLSVVIPSLTGGACCTAFTGTHTLTFQNTPGPPISCNWLKTFSCDGNSATIKVDYDNIGTFGADVFALSIVANFGPFAHYTIPAASFDCLGSNVFSLHSSGTSSYACATWPATLTVNPA